MDSCFVFSCRWDIVDHWMHTVSLLCDPVLIMWLLCMMWDVVDHLMHAVSPCYMIPQKTLLASRL